MRALTGEERELREWDGDDARGARSGGERLELAASDLVTVDVYGPRRLQPRKVDEGMLVGHLEHTVLRIERPNLHGLDYLHELEQARVRRAVGRGETVAYERAVVGLVAEVAAVCEPFGS